MRFAVPLLGDRVAPRCTFADSILLVSVRHRRILERDCVPVEGSTWADLAGVLSNGRVDTMICGGISRSTRESVQSRGVEVIENVVGTADEVVEALRNGRLEPGFGFSKRLAGSSGASALPPPGSAGAPPQELPAPPAGALEVADCLACHNRVCLSGRMCPCLAALPGVTGGELGPPPGMAKILESAVDVACEQDRALCRLAELVYFALEMGYRRIGVAFCLELLEPAKILAQVLGRFFDVLPVCCKIGGGPVGESPVNQRQDDPFSMVVACDPCGQAAMLDSWHADLNVIVGLCVGADSVFARASRAPVTTVFVKDRSLANNPIGALYSHYHLQDL